MAIFVVVAGVLLMLGGATALLFGFDIVMTERGSAMVIGGTVTLSGGAITVGIGFALVKLNQILRTLDLRDGKMLRATTQTDRPVVPMTASETALPPQSVSSLPQEPPLAGMAAASVAGATVGGFAIASAAVAGYSMMSKTDIDTTSQNNTDLSERDVIALVDEIPAENIEIEANTAQQKPMSSLDLEAELSRALSETDYNSEKDRQFTAGLSELLFKPNVEASHALVVDTPHENSSKKDNAPEEMAVTDSDMSDEETPNGTTAHAGVSQDSNFVHPHSDIRADNDDTLESIGSGSPVSADGADLDSESSAAIDLETEHENGVAPIRESVRPEILRTYNTGGRSYTIYVDGSVEAVTKNGVESFRSMEEFRHHLTNG